VLLNCSESGEMNRYSCFVISAAPGIEAPATEGWLIGPRVPIIIVSRGLDIMVGIQHHCGSAGLWLPPSNDSRFAPVVGIDTHRIKKARRGEERPHTLGAALDVRGVKTIP
jgi:hypothetical protein